MDKQIITINLQQKVELQKSKIIVDDKDIIISNKSQLLKHCGISIPTGYKFDMIFNKKNIPLNIIDLWKTIIEDNTSKNGKLKDYQLPKEFQNFSYFYNLIEKENPKLKLLHGLFNQLTYKIIDKNNKSIVNNIFVLPFAMDAFIKGIWSEPIDLEPVIKFDIPSNKYVVHLKYYGVNKFVVYEKRKEKAIEYYYSMYEHEQTKNLKVAEFLQYPDEIINKIKTAAMKYLVNVNNM